MKLVFSDTGKSQYTTLIHDRREKQDEPSIAPALGLEAASRLLNRTKESKQNAQDWLRPAMRDEDYGSPTQGKFARQSAREKEAIYERALEINTWVFLSLWGHTSCSCIG